MKKLTYLLVIPILWSCQPEEKQAANLNYPETKKVDTTDVYFGTEVPDPYRWLEDDTSDETAQWVQAQNQVTNSYLSNIDFRDEVKARLTALENYEKISAPFMRGDYYYFYKNDGLQNQSVLYRVKSFGDEPEVFLDPNSFSEDGTTALGGLSFSDDYKYTSYNISVGGSDWRTAYIMETETKELLDDEIKWIKFSGMSWYKDGFYYQRFDEPKEGDELSATNQYGKIYYHKVGTSQAEDELVYSNPENPENRFGAGVSEDERFLFIYSYTGTSGNELYVKDLSDPNGDFNPIVTGFENDHYIVDNDGDDLIIHTNLGAPNNRIVRVNYQNPTPENWVDMIPETENVMNANTGGGNIFASYLIDAKTAIKQYDYQGSLIRDVELPGIGTASGFGGGAEDEEFFYNYTSFTTPSSVYRYNIARGASELHRRPELDFNPDEYETKQIFYTSKDGTKVPMFIVHKKGLELNGKNPTWLYSYGGFNISLRPSFSTSRLVWLENGGVFAMPNIRGGGEYGEEWHKAGTKLQKINVFEDFIAAGEYLINEGYTSSEYLAIQGGSNGGLLVGATINMRPDLAKVAFPMVGVMDMLRYQNFTIGRAWSADYGTSEDSEEMFKYLHSYSPVHNIDPNATYPAVMVTTADHDDRVVPAHSFKYAATLQEKNADNPNPLLIRIETKAGHGAGMSTEKRIELNADMFSFAWYNMGVIPDIAKERM
ncbi:MAG: prolyl oligopeptidase family serine peptidase [Ekhidna sp.]|uniref:prolyl oligopeptidase family serine peptidase n=1 Tax=Ekhidna sp. TaxID=2608089 RepID=UPI0032EF54B0